MTFYEHIMDLTDEHNITVCFHDGKRCGWAFPLKPTEYRTPSIKEILRNFGSYPDKKTILSLPKNSIVVPRTNTVDAYWVGLHEVGHIVLRHTKSPYKRDRLGCEFDAWDYAFENSIHPLSRKYLNEIYDIFLDTYVDTDQDRDRLDAWYDLAEEWIGI